MGRPGTGRKASAPIKSLVQVSAVTMAAVVACTVVAAASRHILETAAFALLLPFAILLVVARHGAVPAIVAYLVGLLACDFVIVPPAMQFARPGLKDGLTLLLMTTLAAAICVTVERLRRQTMAAQRTARIEGLRNTTLSALSHDLRTPLATLVTASAALDACSMDASTRYRLVQIVAAEATRLDRIVSALFGLTRLQAGASGEGRELELQSVEELIGSALTRLEPQLAAREVCVRLPLEMPLLACDPVLIEQVLINLLVNAIRHAGPSSPIEVTAQANRGEVLIDVSDRGPGVPPGNEELVFRKHHRSASADAPQGLGLGLAICQAIVSAHGGRIMLRNRDGGGASVRVVLPLRCSFLEEAA